MKQKLLGFSLIVSFLLFSLVTTPSSLWHEHLFHFAFLGVLAGAYLGLLFKSPGMIKTQRISLLALSLTLLFLSFHALPCPLLLTPHNALAVSTIAHPCCVSILPVVTVVALLLLKRKKNTSVLPAYQRILPLYATTAGNKSPPFFF